MLRVGDPVSYKNNGSKVVGIYLGVNSGKVSILTPDETVIEIPEYLESVGVLKDKSVQPLQLVGGDIIHKVYKTIGSMNSITWANYNEFQPHQKKEIMKYIDEIVEGFVDGGME